MSTLVPFRPQGGEVAVSDYLTNARDWLATCVEATGPEQIASAKAEFSTVAEMTKQMGLSKEIQSDATEMVRRSEYALGKAIRKGQAEGTVRTQGQGTRDEHRGVITKSAEDFMTPGEWRGQGSEANGISRIADATPAEFDAAITEAKAEGNLSRANVARKIHGLSTDPTKQPFDQRVAQIKALSDKGLSSSQIADEIGLTDQRVRELARRADFTIRADDVMGRSRKRLNWNRVIENVSAQLEANKDLLGGVDADVIAAALDRDQADEWLDSLTTSINALSKAVKKIKESYRG